MAEGKGQQGISLMRLLGALVVFSFKAAAVALAVATPVLGVWVSSSLAAYLNGPIWVTILVGLLFFPLLPLAWEGFSAWRRSRKETKKDRILTFVDRLILRTLVLNLTFLVALLAARPEAGFTAIQARGDWMLEGVDAPWAEQARPWFFKVADRLEWVYVASRDNPYAEDNPDSDVLPDAPGGTSGTGTPPTPPPDRPEEVGESQPPNDGGATPDGGVDSDAGPPPAPAKQPPEKRPPPTSKRLPRWPSSDKLHPVVVGMPPSAEESIESVGLYIKERVHEPLGQIRAIHDWVADRIAYDGPALKLPRLPPQNPELIFENRIGVCSGYALLMREIAQHVGVEVVYVVGDSRDRVGKVGGAGHAWNAVKLDGAWYLIDSTWDAGYLENGSFVKRYSTRYFLAPPNVFGLNHYPDIPAWQLREPPLSRGDFMRQPMLDPRFFTQQMELLEPRRSQITVDGQVQVRISNPGRYFVMSSYLDLNAPSGTEGTDCDVQQGPTVVATCRFSRPGNWRVRLFTNNERYGRYAYAGQILVNSN